MHRAKNGRGEKKNWKKGKKIETKWGVCLCVCVCVCVCV